MSSRKPNPPDALPAPRRDPRELAAIFSGGAAGAVLRVLLARAESGGGPHWPWTTFVANLAGAFLLGWLATRLQERLPLSSYRRPLLATGFCGAFTTFSTVQLELLQMVDADRTGLAVAYAATSVVLGLACVQLATALARRTRVLA